MSVESLATAKEFLDSKKITYREEEGKIVVDGDIEILKKDLVGGALPNLSDVELKGSFYCFDNQLTSLAGAPQTVGKDFNCNSNQLTSLEALRDKQIGGTINAADNPLLRALAKKYKLRGVSLWRLGDEDPGIWRVVDSTE